jgi:hypothetical protein
MHAQIVLFDGFDPLDVIGTGEEVPLADDTLTGTSKAERLPASKVTGQRRTILAATEHRP